MKRANIAKKLNDMQVFVQIPMIITRTPHFVAYILGGKKRKITKWKSKDRWSQ
jgi:hypothetical protein